MTRTWDKDTQLVALTVKQDSTHFYIAFNMHKFDVKLQLPPPLEGQRWYLIVNTANPSPEDFINEMNAPAIEGLEYTLGSHTAVLLILK